MTRMLLYNSLCRTPSRRLQSIVREKSSNVQRISFPCCSYASVALHTPIYQIFGSNTDVGKTVITAGICRASAVHHGREVTYIKPLQTGTINLHNDAEFISRYAKAGDRLDCFTLFSWEKPVSPHLASSIEKNRVTDVKLIETLGQKLRVISNEPDSLNKAIYIETAGGVCSPSSSGSLQADVYRPLRLPVILIGDGKLGGISATISAMESLRIRGYDIAAICMIEQDELNNAQAISMQLNLLSIPILQFDKLPAQTEPLHDWYAAHLDRFVKVIKVLDSYHTARNERLAELQQNAEKYIWWPFTQHKHHGGPTTVIDSAYGDNFGVYKSDSNSIQPMFDACASWWTQGVGHGNSTMATAIAYAAGRYGHVMFPENTHEPAFRLSKRMIETFGKGWASRAFYSDDGSTAVEVALKMAFRKFLVDNELSYSSNSTLKVLAQSNCYHGDTLGVMNVAEEGVFNKSQHPWYRTEAAFLQLPSVAFRHGKLTIQIPSAISGCEEEANFTSFDQVFDLPRRANELLAEKYKKYIETVIADTQKQDARIGALLIEPVLLGSGGMILTDPLFQNIAVSICRHQRIPVIYDEVFSGCWRLGVESGRDLLGIHPDISCFAKLLTGGVVPLAVTLASEPVFESFYADTKPEALLHGHSFTGYPIGCTAANTALDMYVTGQQHIKIAKLSEPISAKLAALTQNYLWDQDCVMAISNLPGIARAISIGTVCIIELQTSSAGYASSSALTLIRELRKEDGMYMRPLGNVIYMMASPLSDRDACNAYIQKLYRRLQQI